MKKRSLLLPALFVALLAAACSLSSGSKDEVTGPVTYENLYQRDVYWPYHVKVTEPWKPRGFQGERFGYGLGVLVRVEPSGELRVDFARHGEHLVPARVTNVLEQANLLWRGEKTKDTPNFVLAVANKAFSPSSHRYLHPATLGHVRAYLLVAADPADARFADLAAALEPLRTRRDLLPILFPQGGHHDDTVFLLLVEAGWTRPFLYSTFTEPYTESIFGHDLALPAVILQSPNGRVLHSSRWRERAHAALLASIERELGPVPRPAVEVAEEAKGEPVEQAAEADVEADAEALDDADGAGSEARPSS